MIKDTQEDRDESHKDRSHADEHAAHSSVLPAVRAGDSKEVHDRLAQHRLDLGTDGDEDLRVRRRVGRENRVDIRGARRSGDR